MKNILLILLISIFAYSCNSSKKAIDSSIEITTAQDTVRIANDELEYEVIIIDPGFNTWIQTKARPKGYYGQTYLETRNQILAREWNSRVLQPQRYDSNLYEMQINYQPNIDYGYEVNYLIYNYFLYFQLKYDQRLSNFVPRI